MHEDYLRPQENGSHTDCDYLILKGKENTFAAAGERTFSFNVSPYTQEELTAKDIAMNYSLVEVRSCAWIMSKTELVLTVAGTSCQNSTALMQNSSILKLK